MTASWIRFGRMGAIRLGALAVLLSGGLAIAGGTASAASSVTAPSSGQAGKTIIISGSGWTPLETVDAYLDQGSTNTYFCGLSTDASGNLGPASCTLPPGLPQGAYTLSVTDQTVTVNNPFTLNPAAHVGATSTGGAIGSVAAGQTVYLDGNGFTASSTITTVKVGATTVTTNPAAPPVTAAGGFTGVAFTVPPSLAAGSATVTVTDSANHSATFKVNVYAATDTAPSSGISGAVVAIGGSGWPSYDTAYTYLEQGATQTYVCSVSTDGSGNLGPQACTLPTSLPEGSYVLSVTDQRVAVNESFTLDPGAHVGATSTGAAIGSVARGQTVYLSGSGFSASSTISKVTVGTKSVVLSPASPAVSAQGAFTGVSFVVPGSTTTGSQTITVTDSSGHSATFKEAVYAATDTASSSGVSGRSFKILGTGWPSNETVYAYLDQGSTATYMCSISTDASGMLGPEGCTLPSALPHGAYTLSVTDQSIVVNKSFTLDAGAHVGATLTGGAIGSAAAGQTVYLTGNGFNAGTTLKSVKVGTTALTLSPTSAPISAQGAFTGVAVSIPSTLAAGATTFTVTDSSGQAATLVLTVYDATSTVATSGKAGHNLPIAGAGWPTDDTVYAYLDQGTTQVYVCSISTDDSGNLGPQSCELPTSLPQGSYTLSLTDQSVTVDSAFTLNPEAELFNASNQQISSAAPGATLGLTGNGFTASSTITSVKVGSTAVTTTPSPPLVNASGSFSATSFVVPALAAGSYTVTITDSSGRSATAPLTIT